MPSSFEAASFVLLLLSTQVLNIRTNTTSERELQEIRAGSRPDIWRGNSVITAVSKQKPKTKRKSTVQQRVLAERACGELAKVNKEQRMKLFSVYNCSMLLIKVWRSELAPPLQWRDDTSSWVRSRMREKILWRCGLDWAGSARSFESS